MTETPEVIAVAGASGFVGSALGPVLARRFETVGLSRRARPPGGGYGQWRATDLFSLADAERGLAGCDRAVYLVHSMLPTDRLARGRFEDFDLICADNFARAASRVGVKQIIYLGGLVPSDAREGLSRHLASRLETERTLASHGVPVVALRAGLVIGAGGSSFVIMRQLVSRLPLMVCPAWTGTLTQPVALADVVRIIDRCFGHEQLAGSHDIGCPEAVTYRDMMLATAEALGKKRRLISVPLLTIGLSRLWVSLVTGAPKELVAPLIQSLAHPMVARDLELQRKLGLEPTTLKAALAAALDPNQALRTRLGPSVSSRGLSNSPLASAAEPPSLTPSARLSASALDLGLETPASSRTELAPLSKPPSPVVRRRSRRRSALVRAVHRMHVAPGRDAVWVAREYMTWLPRTLGPILRVEIVGDRTRFYARPIATPLLELTLSPERSTPDRQLLYVTGGLLADLNASTRPRLEFRMLDGGTTVLAAVHDFAPSLPWPIYLTTQALVHDWVMHRFCRHLEAASAHMGL
ncbi:putative nucleoside-diphosphate-sugar epimerase [Enhygromyxa salina]|uniref:Putative nucleoside-diphosphate-sugar epimerase n=1 Tax=Enhygromyxa salina TaxID=215803 RepID=A0A0C2CR65_9BACT|nr:hypothetical protein [Enhygromyxa salina]KIG12180.1 putative nucleoside-diphosphate-sugar epimerase [Enhygromyxa salina]